MRNLRFLVASVFCLVGVFAVLVGMGPFSSAFAQGRGNRNNRSATSQDTPGTQTPDVVHLVGPAVVKNLHDLPYIPPNPAIERKRLTIFPFPLSGGPGRSRTSAFPRSPSLLGEILRPVPNMPSPLLTFDGINFSQSGGYLPDTDGDVGPNHYVQTVNVGFRVFDKVGNPLAPFTTYNSFFAPLGTSTPCGNHQNVGDVFAFYDQMADRWVVTDFAYPSPGNSFWECIGVSQTPDPTGAYNLYALHIDPANPSFQGDYPKFALWNNPQPGGAYHLMVDLFNPDFQGVRAFALDRAAMLNGNPNPTVIAFTIPFAAMPPIAFYSLVPAGFRTGNPPPAGRDEFLLAVDSPDTGGVVLTHVHGWYFHVDFVTPANSTFGTGPNHLPNADITVNGFVDARTDATDLLVPQLGTADKLDTLGDKIMTPVVYQNRNGTESLWADQTIILNYPNGPTAVRWYQFNVTGGTFPATPVQQQDWTNGNDGLWRWMPSIAVDQNGNTAIGYSVSSPSMFPGIRYAGRLASDPSNDLGQGEAIMTNGGGSQLDRFGRWGDYSMTTIDPADSITFWHTNEYYRTTSAGNWFTRVGKFNFPRTAPTPRPRPTPPPRP